MQYLPQNKKIEKNLFKINKNLETRKTLNRSPKTIPMEIIDNIEKNGLTVENLDVIKKELELPIFQYSTQITVHGVAPRELKDRLFGYKLITNNKNKSIGISYKAIDRKKKLLIADVIRKDRYFNTSINNALNIYRYIKIENIADINKNLKIFKDKIKVISPNFIGDINVNLYNLPFYGKFIALEITVKAIYQKYVWEFIESVTGINEIRFNELKDIEEKKYNELKKLKEKSFNEKQEKIQKAYDKFIKLNNDKFSDISEIDVKNGEIVFCVNKNIHKISIFPIYVFTNKQGNIIGKTITRNDYINKKWNKRISKYTMCRNLSQLKVLKMVKDENILNKH